MTLFVLSRFTQPIFHYWMTVETMSKVENDSMDPVSESEPEDGEVRDPARFYSILVRRAEVPSASVLLYAN